MRRNWMAVLCTVLTAVFLAALVHAQDTERKESKQVTCTGKVVDEPGRPMANVKVSLHEMVYDEATYTYDPKTLGEVQTGTDGVFSFNETVKDNQYRYGYIVAVKEGLALGFDNWTMQDGDKELEIKLGQPKELAGIVVDDKDSPVSDARVAVSILALGDGSERKNLNSPVVPKLLTVNTDATGKFSFTHIPAGATAEFIVEKSGKATVSTYKRTSEPYQKLNFTEGQKDIRLVLPVEAKIEGMAVEKSTGQPVGGVKISCTSRQETGYVRPKPFASKHDGTFSIDALAATRYVIAILQSNRELPDWVANPVEVFTEAGKTNSNVKIELSKGGVLEVKVTDAVKKEPVKEVSVGIQHPVSGLYKSSRSNENGIAMLRLMPGDYQVYSVYKEGYSQQRLQDKITIEEGEIKHLEYELIGMPTLTGIVRDKEGQPIEGAIIHVCPTGRDACTSNAEGKFEAVFDPGGWMSNQVPLMFLVGTHGPRNLAAALQIGEDTRKLDLVLEPAVTLCGRVVDQDGRGIANAQVRVWMRASSWGSTMRTHEPVQTDNEGGFEFKAIPRGQKYTFYVSAEGYGENPRDDFDTAGLKGNRLDVGKLTLAIANLSVSGVVVDASDKPVAGASVYCSGEGQAHSQAVTDTEGKFTLEKVCAGKIRISADKSDVTRLYGYIETEGGATDVRIVISERPSSTRYEPRRPASLVGRPLPELKDVGVDLPMAETDGKMMLVCFFDMEQRPSRHCVTQLAKQAEQLNGKGVTIVAVQASKMEQDTLNKWKNEYNIPFPVGMIESDADKARFTWGIHSLPWLILTDSEHIVRTAGFQVNQLDEKIGEMTNVER